MVQKHSTKLSWDGLEAICLVGRYGTVRRAAKHIGVAHTTMAKRIALAERRLGVVAFVRGPKGYVPTAAGNKIIAHAERMSHEVAAITKDVTDADSVVSGRVSVSLLPSVLSNVLNEQLGSFVARYPQIQLEFITDGALSDLDRNRADIVVRFQDNPAEHLWGRKVAAMFEATYSSPEFQQTYADSTLPVPTIGWSSKSTVMDRAASHGINHADIRYITTDLRGQADLAASGHGVALLPCFVGDHHKGLVRFMPTAPIRINDVWVLTHPDHKTSTRVQKVAQFCGESIQKKSHLFAGKLRKDWL